MTGQSDLPCVPVYEICFVCYMSVISMIAGIIIICICINKNPEVTTQISNFPIDYCDITPEIGSQCLLCTIHSCHLITSLTPILPLRPGGPLPGTINLTAALGKEFLRILYDAINKLNEQIYLKSLP